jgi:hypothetical protein
MNLVNFFDLPLAKLNILYLGFHSIALASLHFEYTFRQRNDFSIEVTGLNKVCSTIARDLNNSVKLDPVKNFLHLLAKIPNELAKPAPPSPPPDFRLQCKRQTSGISWF